MTCDLLLGIWGQVTRLDSDNQIRRVRVDASKPVGFIVVTQEKSGEFDVWLETKEEVLQFLEPLEVVWEGRDGT